MKKIYLVLTYTGTILSRIIKVYTGKTYAHVSISLDENLEEMYSFGRLNPYIAFIGGFVHENKRWGTFKRFKNTKAIVCSIDVTDEQYAKLQDIIIFFKENRKKYKFNIIGLAMVLFNIKYKPKNSFYCAEFVKYALEKAHVSNNLPEIIKPLDFLNINNIQIIYEGMLRDYNSKNKCFNIT